MQVLDFENPITELDQKIQELSRMSNDGKIDILQDISNLQKKRDKLLRETYENLTPFQKVQIARHVDRPHFKDYINHMTTDFVELSGDRLFAEDAAILGGLARIEGRTIMIMGHEKGSDLDSRLKHNFGMPLPEGYRKAQRLMKLAEQYQIPIVTIVDTAGAYPGIGAEERGQSEAIAKSIETCLSVTVPIISVIIGEGGSGGAIAIATANKVFMLEHSIYSVISPEGCASILWRSREKKEEAAEAQKLTAQDLKRLNIIDDIISEPLGGAHRDSKKTILNVKKMITEQLDSLSRLRGSALKSQRSKKYLQMGKKV
ncbi:MAG: acetyl-CoA carboxylase carboxyl transferase subunit alpha [Alphaproteobacteria bacterium]|nr:MAG: acetyl-CoA carboxylase carboxyl transferase subunit alpha [Alphaproteobacteria bacterium]